MPRFIVRVSLASLLFTAACTQTPAQVDLRGGTIFGRNGPNSGSNYASKSVSSPKSESYSMARNEPAAPVSQTTEQNASVSAVSVSELAPPPVKEEKVAAAALAKPEPAAQKTASINPWTKKPRVSDEEETRQVASLDKPAEKEKPVPAAYTKTAPSKATGFMWPVSGRKVVSGYGPKGAGKANDGINIASPEGEPVWAAADGEVVYSGNELKGYGNMVLIKHSGSKTTTYAHLSRATVDKYDRVKQGDIIGYVGSTGNVKSPQLHFAIRDGKDPVDPKKYLSTSMAGL